MASGRTSKSLDVSKRQPEAKGASLQPHDLFLRFVRALAQHQARKDHREEIESRRERCEIKENRNVGHDDV